MTEYPVTARRETPVHDAPGRWRGMIARAFAVALFVFVLALAVPAFVDRLNKDAGMRFSTQFTFAAAMFGLSGAASLAIEWLLMNKTRIAWAIEEAFGVDVDGDGRVGEPAQPPIDVWVPRQAENGWDKLDLPGTPTALMELSEGLLAGQGFTEAAWTGRDRPYTKAQFHTMRQEMLRRGLIRWRNQSARAQGVELTRAGKAAFEELQSHASHAHASKAHALTAPGQAQGEGG